MHTKYIKYKLIFYLSSNEYLLTDVESVFLRKPDNENKL